MQSLDYKLETSNLAGLLLRTSASRPGAPGDARVVHFVETLHGLVAVVLSALQQVVRGHGAAIVVGRRSAGRWRRPGRAGRSRRVGWLGPAGWSHHGGHPALREDAAAAEPGDRN